MPIQQLCDRFDEKFPDKGWDKVIYSAEFSSGKKEEITQRIVIKSFLRQSLIELLEEVYSKMPKQRRYESLGSPDSLDFVATHNYNLAVSEVKDLLNKLKV